MKGDITVVIPTMVESYLVRTLEQISKTLRRPSHVIVFNNSPGSFISDFNLFPFPISIENAGGGNRGVNEPWNLAMALVSGRSHLCFLNDDVLLNRDFFSRILQAFDKSVDAGIVCPHSCATEDGFRILSKEYEGDISPRQIDMKRREGWAFTLRRQLVSDCPHIPKSLKIFCGDDWIFRWVWKTGWKAKKDMHNVIYHMVGQTTKLNPELRAKLNREKELFSHEWNHLLATIDPKTVKRGGNR